MAIDEQATAKDRHSTSHDVLATARDNISIWFSSFSGNIERASENLSFTYQDQWEAGDRTKTRGWVDI